MGFSDRTDGYVYMMLFTLVFQSEVGLVARAMIRLLRANKETQYIVLTNIATMALHRRGMFEPYIKSFYIRASDPIHVKLLKLEILTSLATDSNVSVMMREFQVRLLACRLSAASWPSLDCLPASSQLACLLSTASQPPLSWPASS